MTQNDDKKYLKSEGFYIEPSEIYFNEADRRPVEKPELEDMKKSISELGQLQPIIVDRDKKLIAGLHRLKACIDLGRKVWAVFTDDVDPILLKKIEYHENSRRAQLDAAQDVLAKEEIYQMMLERTGGRASQTDLAKELQLSAGLVSEDLKFASYIKQLPAFFADCKTKTDIRQRIKRMERKAEEYVLQKAADKMSTDVRLDKLRTITGVTHEQLEQEKAQFEDKTTTVVVGEEKNVEEKIKEYNERLMFGKWQDHLPKVKREMIDLMLLDPPWGVELQEKIEAGMLQGDAYEDTEEEFLREFPKLIRLCYRKMRDGGHLYCFFAIRHYQFVKETFTDAGFNGIDRPIIVHKQGRASGRQGDHWPVSSCELLYLWKKGRRPMNYGGISDVLSIPWISPSDKRGHPSAKPAEVYSKILEWSARPGDTICDPTYGSGAAFLACEQRTDLKLNWFGWENDPGARRVALMRLTEHQVEKLNQSQQATPSISSGSEEIKGKSHVEHTPPKLPEDFRDLTPGTTEWAYYWRENKDKQDDMLAFKKEWLKKNGEKGKQQAQEHNERVGQA